jgi:hypothetical protein
MGSSADESVKPNDSVFPAATAGFVANAYTFDNRAGWRRYRLLQPGRGMYHDVKRRLPYYWSDITDAWTYRVVASTVRMYLVK